VIKYWGKARARRPEDANLPAVPSLSLTLDALYTETTVRFAPDAAADHVVLDGAELGPAATARAKVVLDRVRALAAVASPFAVESVNHVPTAAGLASSASGMAALAMAAARCAGLADGPGPLVSRLARLGSGSASRSVYGGWVTWEGAEATPLAPVDHLDVALVVAIVDAGPKAISSRDAMNLTARTSPFYAGWVRQARGTFDEGVGALKARDLAGLIAAMEASTLRMHACAMAARPPVRYWQPASLAAIGAVEGLRAEGLVAGWTMDAGPNVKVLCGRDDVPAVRGALARVDGISSILVSRPGPGVSLRIEG
jgi:diphosphomevalonate decarboxylase